MSGVSGLNAFVHCRPDRLSREELARYELWRDRLNKIELWRGLFYSESSFTAAVEALERNGRLPSRPDGTYRVWDAYTVIDRLCSLTYVTIPGPTPVTLSLPVFPHLFHLPKLDETWWESVDAARVGLDAEWAARHILPWVEDPVTGKHREETLDEWKQRYDAVRSVVEREVKELAQLLAADEASWTAKLGTHAWIVVELRDAHLDPLARLCADHLSAAVHLAQLALSKTRREIRALVKGTQNDMTSLALSVASFSRAQRSFDAAIDEMEASLGAYNTAMPVPLQLTHDQPQRFAEFLTESGLQEWYTQLSVFSWDWSVLNDRSEDQRIAMVYGRVRTLCSLLEEALLSLAESTGDVAFWKAVEKQPTLQPRLDRFLRGPTGRAKLVAWPQVQRFATANKILPGMDARTVAASFAALGMPAGKDPRGVVPSPEQVLGSLIVLRNFTSHRFPIVHATGRVAWFEAWGNHLPAINRTVLWAALMLWAITRKF